MFYYVYSSNNSPLDFGERILNPQTQDQAEGKNLSLSSFNDARTGMPPGIPEGAMCVQRFDDSLNSAIHTTYRISLRSSSMGEPRDPLLKVLTFNNKQVQTDFRENRSLKKKGRQQLGWSANYIGHTNDPSAGSPTETLLRLLLPLNDQV
jgi:hypothetical protein